LGLKLCNTFGFNTNKVLAWRNNAGDDLDKPNFSETDQSHLHFLKVRHSFSKKSPWFIIFFYFGRKCCFEVNRKTVALTQI